MIVKKIKNKILGSVNSIEVAKNELESLGVKCSEEHLSWIIDALAYIKELKKEFSDEFIVKAMNKTVEVSLKEYRFEVSNKSEFLILKEVFVDRTYDFNLKDKINVVDIGMNVGISSVFFAGKENVLNVYSFEPVDSTYADALKNFGLNKKISNRINPFNFGLYSSNTKMKFTFNPGNKGSFGFVGNEKFKKDQNEYVEKEVELRDAKDVFNEYVVNSDEEYIVKMDCEGAEYDIIPELVKLNKLPLLFMIEWHLSRGNEIVEVLENSGYVVVHTKTERTAGVIYAFRQ